MAEERTDYILKKNVMLEEEKICFEWVVTSESQFGTLR